MKFDISDIFLYVFLIFMLLLILWAVFCVVLSIAGLLPDEKLVLVIDGVSYDDVTDVVIAVDSISFTCKSVSDNEVRFNVPYTNYRFIVMRKGFFESEYEEEQQ